MSSRNVKIEESPCKKYLQWKSTQDANDKINGGAFFYWDKNKGEKGENVMVDIPFKFALISDDAVCFKGYSEKRKQGVYSNEVIKPQHEVKIKSKEGVLMTFLLKDYKDNKDAIEGLGAKYTKSVYIAVHTGTEWELWNLQLNGAALSGATDRENPKEEEKFHGWFGFTKGFKSKLYTNYIEIKDFELKKKGATKFTIPLYSVGEAIADEDMEILNGLTTALNDWHKYYFNKPEEIEE